MNETLAPSAAAASAPSRKPGRRFYTLMALAIVLTVFAGFAPTFYLRGAGAKPLTPLMVLHGVLFTVWIALFVAQVRLVATKRTHIHRKLGLVAVGVAVAMVVAGTTLAIASAKKGFTPPNGPPPLVFLAIPIADMIVFPTLVGLGFFFRRKSEIHKRLMLLSTLAILTPAIARISLITPHGIPVFLGITDLFIISALIYDRVRNGRIHPAFLWGGLFVMLSHPARILFAGTPAWHSIATWLTR